MMKSILTLDCERLSNEIFQIDFLPKQPLKIVGLGETWVAMKYWSENFFRKNHGSLIVPVRKYGNRSCYTKVHMKLTEYLDYWKSVDNTISDQNNLYLADWEISKQQSPLLEDFTTPLYFRDDLFNELPSELKFGRTWVFIGHQYVSTPLHQDTFATSAWLTMIHGSKTIRMVPPTYGSFFNKNDSLFCEEVISRLLKLNVPIYEVTIQRGDTLFIPGRWFHEVINLNKNIMLTKNFLDKWNYLHFTTQIEKKFNEPLMKIRQARKQFMSDHANQPYLTNPHLENYHD